MIQWFEKTVLLKLLVKHQFATHVIAATTSVSLGTAIAYPLDTIKTIIQDPVGDEDNLPDDGSHMLGGTTKRLNLEKVRALEKIFELGNKLEPERKMQLAKALGLQTRQIANWFHNRRPRWKTKHLGRDYDTLKKQFDVLKSDNDSLLAHNKKLHDGFHRCQNSNIGCSLGPMLKTPFQKYVAYTPKM
ncbi:unnamed protein product [Eruca vesicaria subsp. sativa]|uniref:Homeobox-leucine zipper protein n=1 Tax=Eruca vesicaria subsp. sativa TaxID=29727 RepID=A0ABC8KSR5_ERUVS|nr:unnamed protein product [Eruca vesicaria subsp. sativa]